MANNTNRSNRVIPLSFGTALVLLIAVIFSLNPYVDTVVEAQSSTVDFRLIPGIVTVESGASFTITIQVEPNGQATAGAQVFIDFDPDHIRVDSIALEPGSPFNITLINKFDNSAGTIDLAAGAFLSPPSSTFTLATIFAEAKSVNTFTSLEFSTVLPRRTVASIDGAEIQRELIGTTIAVGHTDPVDLKIEKTGTPKTVRAGDELTYSIEVTNTGTTTATQVTVSDILPSGITLASVSSTQGSCDSDGSVLTCNLGSMAAGSTSSIGIITIPSISILGEEPKNIVNVTSNQIDLNPFNNTASTTTEIPAVSYLGLIILGGSMAFLAFVVRVRARYRRTN